MARSLIGQFEVEAKGRRSLSPIRELDDLIFERDNYFPGARSGGGRPARRDRARGAVRRSRADRAARAALRRRRDAQRRIARLDAAGFPGQYQFNADSADDVVPDQRDRGDAPVPADAALCRAGGVRGDRARGRRRRSCPRTRRGGSPIARSAPISPGAIVFPYARFLADAEALRYDIEALRQTYTASFEQVAHRLVTLRKPGRERHPLRLPALRSGRAADQALPAARACRCRARAMPVRSGRSTARSARRMRSVRQVVQFADGSRYLFIAKAEARRVASFADRAAIHTSVMLACDVLHADRTVYGTGLDLADRRGRCAGRSELPALPAARLRRPAGGGADARRPAGGGAGAAGAAAFRYWRSRLSVH